MDTWMAQPASQPPGLQGGLDCRGAAAAVAAVAVGACSAMCLELIKWLMRQDGLGLPGAPLQDAAKCLLPPGHRDIYKVLKFGVSLRGEGHYRLPLGSFFIF